MSEPRPKYDVLLFFLLACGITWAMDLPFVLALLRQEQPAPHAMLLGGLGAWGPTLAALVLASWYGQRREVFGRWRTRPVWIVVALLAPAALHLPAAVMEALLGGSPQWLLPPERPEHFAAMIMFSFGEEFGWRGFAYPRLADRHGPVAGALIVGAVWGLWHLGMWFTPEKGAPDLWTMGSRTMELMLFSVILAWLLERGQRSLWIAIAFHAGGHLDNVHRIPETETRLHLLRWAVLAVAAVFAARALLKKRPANAADVAPAT